MSDKPPPGSPPDPSVPHNAPLRTIIQQVVREELSNPNDLPQEFLKWLPSYATMNDIQHGHTHQNRGPDPIPIPESGQQELAFAYGPGPVQVAAVGDPAGSVLTLAWDTYGFEVASTGTSAFTAIAATSAASAATGGPYQLAVTAPGAYFVNACVQWWTPYGGVGGVSANAYVTVECSADFLPQQGSYTFPVPQPEP